MVELGQDETAETGPSDRDLTGDGTGRLGLAFNNPSLFTKTKEFRWTFPARTPKREGRRNGSSQPVRVIPPFAKSTLIG